MTAAGSLAATGPAVIGSGAFTTANVNRDVEVTVTTDESGSLLLFPNRDYSGAGG